MRRQYVLIHNGTGDIWGPFNCRDDARSFGKTLCVDAGGLGEGSPSVVALKTNRIVARLQKIPPSKTNLKVRSKGK